MKFDWVFQKLFIWTSIQTSILNRFLCNFAGNIDYYHGKFPVSLTKFDKVLQKLLMRLVWNFIEYFKICSFGRQFRRQFSTVFHVILQAPSPGITATSLLIWQSLIKYFKSYSFRRQFRRQFSTVFHVILQAPLPGITATSLLIWRSLIKYFKSYSFRRQFRRQFSTVFHVILQATSTAITASSL